MWHVLKQLALSPSRKTKEATRSGSHNNSRLISPRLIVQELAGSHLLPDTDVYHRGNPRKSPQPLQFPGPLSTEGALGTEATAWE